jgi:hypothetical protein
VRFALFALLVAAPAAAQEVSRPPVGEGSAYRWSLLATVLPVAAGTAILVVQGGGVQDRSAPAVLITSGLLVGPSLGYAAAGLGGRGLRGIGIRGGLGLATIIAAIGICGMDCSPKQDKADVANYVSLVGVALIATDAAYDISRLRHNIRRRASRAAIAPVYLPSERRLGVRLQYSF